MFFGFFWGDWTILILIPAMIFAIAAQSKVKSTFNRYAKVHNRRGLTGAEAARRVLDANGLYHVKIEQIHGHLTDHFDPRANVIRLSDATYASTGIAAVGVAAHEAGHAVQHAEEYVPVRIRTALVPVTNFGSSVGIWLIMIGVILASLAELFVYVAFFGIILFSLTAIFQLVTLPVEFNASRRAMEALHASGSFSRAEEQGARRVLTAAAMTYVAALAVTLAQLLRLLIIVANASGRRRD